MILGIGAATAAWHGATGWFEAGESFRYSYTVRGSGQSGSRLIAAGWRYAKGFESCWRAESTGCSRKPATMVSSSAASGTICCCIRRIALDTRFRSTEGFGSFHSQVFWNWNATTVTQPVSIGRIMSKPDRGSAFKFEGMPAPLTFSVTRSLRGAYLINAKGNPRRTEFPTMSEWGSGMRSRDNSKSGHSGDRRLFVRDVPSFLQGSPRRHSRFT